MSSVFDLNSRASTNHGTNYYTDSRVVPDIQRWPLYLLKMHLTGQPELLAMAAVGNATPQ